MEWRQKAGRVSCKVCIGDLSSCLLIRVLPETHRIPSRIRPRAIPPPHAETQWVVMLEKKPKGMHRMIRKPKSTAPGAHSRKMFPLLTLLTLPGDSRDTFRCDNRTHPARKYRTFRVFVKLEARLLITHVPGRLYKSVKRPAGYFSKRLKGRAAVGLRRRQSKFRANLMPGIGEAGCHWQTDSGSTGFLARVEQLGRRQMRRTFQPCWTVSSVSRVIDPDLRFGDSVVSCQRGDST